MSKGAREDGSWTFYLFDLDDNTLFLDTKVALRNTVTGKEKLIGTHEFAAVRQQLGEHGFWQDYEIYDGTYRFFRDRVRSGADDDTEEYLVADIKEALAKKDPSDWQAPSWSMFVHACNNGRPLSIITARGHSAETIKVGIQILLAAGYIEKEPNYLSIYAVSNDASRAQILANIPNDDEREAVEKLKDPTSMLKRYAIHQTVEKGLEDYGSEPPHRFGMSDDDPGNIDLIVKAMAETKEKHPDKRFFAINTHSGRHVKLEVYPIDFPVTQQKSSIAGFIN
ncbi:hypothetical protein [uncultured Roseobacter sp.]|uniref:hypothetical protein n=1 Tax=uncultured Roseobacter sp. TaxID=114847 RepID=UPI002617F2D8|nr:hypothetical protein [uncultured Roseobacter sp.]